MATPQTFSDRLNDVNEHRLALGRPPFGAALSLADLLDHEALVAKHAPYGQDPWADTDGVDRAAPPRTLLEVGGLFV